ncbi:DUF2971 domain-containing protein [Shewanella sp. TC10]|uniref:DUF2971 domain-containing protein n=1 Tax=Shewanella sp. TC10 TaxID=1419739 RepID=UPI00129EABD0|nr:DUF2971 domain-containing protein [Shewanella sp. TC10]
MNEDTIYHYTSVDGLLGVLKNKEIWFTDYEYLNDIGEFVKARSTLSEKLRLLDLEKARMNLDLLFRQIESKYSLCVCSFSNVCDSLTQWRFYGDDCKGSCIGFRPSILRINSTDCQLNGSTQPNFNGNLVLSDTFRCDYSSLDGYVEKVIEEFKELFEELEKLKCDDIYTLDSLPPVSKHDLFKLIKQLFAWKHSDFKSEQETRAIALVPSEQLKYRISQDTIVPYYTRDLENLFVNHSINVIVLGAKCNVRNALSVSRLSSQYDNHSMMWGINARKLEEKEPAKFKTVMNCAIHQTQYI